MAPPYISPTQASGAVHHVHYSSLHDYRALPPPAGQRINLGFIKDAIKSRVIAQEQSRNPSLWEYLFHSGASLQWVDLPSEHLVCQNPLGGLYVRYGEALSQVPFDRAPGGKVHDLANKVVEFLRVTYLETERAIQEEKNNSRFYGGNPDDIWRAEYDTLYGTFNQETRNIVICESSAKQASAHKNIKILEDRLVRIRRTLVACGCDEDCGFGPDFASVSPINSTGSTSLFNVAPLLLNSIENATYQYHIEDSTRVPRISADLSNSAWHSLIRNNSYSYKNTAVRATKITLRTPCESSVRQPISAALLGICPAGPIPMHIAAPPRNGGKKLERRGGKT